MLEKKKRKKHEGKVKGKILKQKKDVMCENSKENALQVTKNNNNNSNKMLTCEYMCKIIRVK